MDEAILNLIKYWEDIYDIAPLAWSDSSEIEIVSRSSGKQEWLILLNHSSQRQVVESLKAGTDLLSRKIFEGGKLEMEPFEVAIIQN